MALCMKLRELDEVIAGCQHFQSAMRCCGEIDLCVQREMSGWDNERLGEMKVDCGDKVRTEGSMVCLHE